MGGDRLFDRGLVLPGIGRVHPGEAIDQVLGFGAGSGNTVSLPRLSSPTVAVTTTDGGLRVAREFRPERGFHPARENRGVALFQALDLSGISVGSIRYRDLTVHFLPEGEAEFAALLARCQKAKHAVHHVSSMATFDRIFDTLVRIKGDLQIYNSAIALITMAELAAKRLDQIEAEKEQAAEPEA